MNIGLFIDEFRTNKKKFARRGRRLFSALEGRPHFPSNSSLILQSSPFETGTAGHLAHELVCFVDSAKNPVVLRSAFERFDIFQVVCKPPSINTKSDYSFRLKFL